MGMIEVDESQYLIAPKYVTANFRCFTKRRGRDVVTVSLVWRKPVLATCNNRSRFLICEEVFYKIAFKED